MDSYRILLFLHVAAAILTIGATFAFPFLQAFAETKGVGATRFVMQFLVRVERALVIPGSVLIILFGVALIFNNATGYRDQLPGWLNVAIPLFIIVVIVDLLVQQRQVKAAIASLEGLPDTAALPAAYTPIGKRIQMVGGLEGLALIVIIFLMTYKPGQ